MCSRLGSAEGLSLEEDKAAGGKISSSSGEGAGRG